MDLFTPEALDSAIALTACYGNWALFQVKMANQCAAYWFTASGFEKFVKNHTI